MWQNVILLIAGGVFGDRALLMWRRSRRAGVSFRQAVRNAVESGDTTKPARERLASPTEMP